MSAILFIIIGLVGGAIPAYLLMRTRLSSVQAMLDQANQLTAKIQPLETERMQLYGKTQADKATIETLRDRIKSLEDDKGNLEVNLRRIVVEVTNESLVRQGKILTEQQSSKLIDILNPLKDRIIEFQSKVESNQTESTKTNSALMEQIKSLTNLNQAVTQKTEDLTNALRGSTKAQGAFGEMILERVLERSGLKKGSEYETQFSTQNVHGDTIRPDAVIYLPENKNIIIDSKVSLIAYEKYTSSDDLGMKDSALKAHMASVKSHIKLLSEKDYHTGIGLNSPDFTLMFMPIESGFALSVKEDTSLFEYAWERKIVIVSPSTLLATLRTIASVWKQENQTRNAIEIANAAGDLYDKFVGFMVDMEKVGKALDSASDAHQLAMNKLSKGKGNLVNRANYMKSLGINSTKKLSSTLIVDEEVSEN
jgi:DNA recombination protein RmuC